MSSSIVVWSDRHELALELLGKAREVAERASRKVCFVVCDDVADAVCERFGASGADVVYQVNRAVADPAVCAEALVEAIRLAEADLVLIGATKLGLDVAPRVAERVGGSCATWATEVDLDPRTGALSVSCASYGGVSTATYRFEAGVTVVTSADGVFEASVRRDCAIRVEPLEAPVSSRVTVLEERKKAPADGRLQKAKAVVDIGRGVELADLELARSLAQDLDAQLACSRPVSADRDWFPAWLGLSGLKVKPQLCLTLGISGAVQHVVGIRGARVIAAVNNDADAAIFDESDIGVVADLHEFLPVLKERLCARSVQPVWREEASVQ
jgi:electron transfer flavoprotein alpha subunit